MDEPGSVETSSAQNLGVTSAPEENPQRAKKPSLIPILLGSSLAVLLLGGLGVFAYQNFVAEKSTSSNSTSPTSVGNGISSASSMPCTFATSTPKQDLSKEFLDSLTFFNKNYAKDSQCVYYYEPLAYPSAFFYAIKQADVATFSPFNPWYAKDKERVYYGSKVITDADPNSFETNGEYGKDGSGLYYETEKIAIGNKNDFDLLGSDFAKNAKNVYLFGSSVPTLDPATFQIISTSTLIVKDRTSVYHVSTFAGDGGIGIGDVRANLELIKDVDSATFKLVSNNVARDKNGVYFFIDYYGFGLNKLQGADPNTFQVLPGIVGYGGESGYGFFSKDAQYVYLGSTMIAGADPASFTPIILPYDNSLQYSTYSKDKNFVYDGSKKLEAADPTTFQLLAPNVWWAVRLAKDNNKVYGNWVFGTPPTFDAPSLQILNNGQAQNNIPDGESFFAKDKNNVYWVSIADDFGGARFDVIPQADSTTFVHLGSQYGKDKTNIYMSNQVLLADRDSFKILEYGVAKDKNKIYGLPKSPSVYISPTSQSQKIRDGIDPATFKMLGQYVAKDAFGAYSFNALVLGKYIMASETTCKFPGTVDLATLRAVGENYAADKNRVYYGCAEVSNADPSTFQELNTSSYAKDTSHAYFGGAPIYGADPATFVAGVNRYAQDKYFRYDDGERE